MMILRGFKGNHIDFMVSALDSGASGPDSSPGWERHYSHDASLHPLQVYKWVPVNLMLGGNPAVD